MHVCRQKTAFSLFAGAMLPAEGRSLYRTQEGDIGLAPPGVNEGDVVYFVKGCRTPLVLRHIKAADELILIGDCCMHGFMHGEAIKSGEPFREIMLV